MYIVPMNEKKTQTQRQMGTPPQKKNNNTKNPKPLPISHSFCDIAHCLLEHMHVYNIVESCLILRYISLTFEICTLCEVFQDRLIVLATTKTRRREFSTYFFDYSVLVTFSDQ